MLKAEGIVDPETEAHYACIRTMRDITTAHCHDFFELFLIVQGRIWHLVGDRRELLEPGALVLIRPHDGHCYEKYGSEECELINLAFPASTWADVARFLGDGLPADGLVEAPDPPHATVSGAALDELAARLKALGAVPAGPKRALRAAVRGLLADVLVHWFANPQGETGQRAPDWLEALAVEMRKRENFTAGLERLHALAPISPEHLCRSIRRHFGTTPTGWINHLRLEYAAHLLLLTDEPIVTVALQAGFENLSHFYHLFREAYRLSPARYRKAARRRTVVPE
jgi:AraC family cel operon transcriptional repressor